MKQLMEDEGCNELQEKYISDNINFIINHINYPNNALSAEQFFNAYIELTEIQFKSFSVRINNGSDYEEALTNAYQTVEYE